MYLIAPFVWGLLEATLLFMVPDVAISAVTLKYGLKKGVMAAFSAAIGAAIGGLIMFYWGINNLPFILSLIEKLPAISTQMIDKVAVQMSGDSPFRDMLLGSVSGVPYKIYASFGASAHINPLLLFLITPFVRLPRFLLVATGWAFFGQICDKYLKQANIKFMVLIGFWVISYALYWTFMPS